MKTFKWNLRTRATVAVAFLLTVFLGAVGVWLLLSGQPGTGMMEKAEQAEMMRDVDHTQMMLNEDHGETMGHMLGTPADRGLFGGYTGTVGLAMIVVFIAMVGLMLFALLREQPSHPQPAHCRNCGRPVETDWTTCPYCGIERIAGTK